MAGKPNDKMFKTMVEKHGSEEAARAWFRSIGSKGGKNGTTGGFATKEPCSCSIVAGEHTKPQCAGSKGGKISRRNKEK